MTELDERIDQLRTTCPTEWATEKSAIKDKIADLEVQYDEVDSFFYQDPIGQVVFFCELTRDDIDKKRGNNYTIVKSVQQYEVNFFCAQLQGYWERDHTGIIAVSFLNISLQYMIPLLSQMKTAKIL